MAFQVGTDSAVLHHADVAGDAVSVDLHQRQPDRVAEALSRSGLDLRVRVVGEPDDTGEFPEQEPQAFLLARRPRAFPEGTWNGDLPPGRRGACTQ
jgi:hypothetical protein